MFSSFCEKLLPKMSNIFHEISKKPSYDRTEEGGWAMILGVRTVWITPVLDMSYNHTIKVASTIR